MVTKRLIYRVACGLVFTLAVQSMPRSLHAETIPEETITLNELINLPEKDLALIDIAAMNLAVAEGLPGTGRIDRKALLRQLDSWAQHVAYETRRHKYRFDNNPEDYDHSWGQYCMLVMTSILQQDFGVHYNPNQITPSDDPAGFDFTRSQDLFINGMLQGTGGTCTSMPVLYVAVGRRLGYPLKLVSTAQHSFLRWDDPKTGERFNIEGTSRGFVTYDDEYYKTWPREWCNAEREDSDYLKSLSPREELAVFLATRGNNLFFSGHLRDANRCFYVASKLGPNNFNARHELARTARMLARLRSEQQAEAAYQRTTKQQRSQPQIVIPGMPTIPVPYAHLTSIRSPTGKDIVMTQQDLFAELRKQPTRVDFTSFNTPPPVPSAYPTAREQFEAMKRRAGVMRHDGSFSRPATRINQGFQGSGIQHRPMNRFAQPVAPVPFRTYPGVRP